jgi:hypothetical protein
MVPFIRDQQRYSCRGSLEASLGCPKESTTSPVGSRDQAAWREPMWSSELLATPSLLFPHQP